VTHGASLLDGRHTVAGVTTLIQRRGAGSRVAPALRRADRVRPGQSRVGLGPVRGPGRVPEDMLLAWIDEGYLAVAPRRLVKALDGA